MDNSNLIAHLQGKEKEIAALTTKLVEFFKAEKANPLLAIGCLSETVRHIMSFSIKDLDDPKAAHAFAEQMAGLFVHAITHSLQEHFKKKADQFLSCELKTPEDISSVSPASGCA